MEAQSSKKGKKEVEELEALEVAPADAAAAASGPLPAAEASAAAKATLKKNGLVKGGHAKLIILILKLLLNVVQGQRELQSILFNIVLLPTAYPLVKA